MSAPRHDRAAFWQRADAIREQWQAIGMAYGATDRSAAEQALTQVYANLGRPRPRFVWVRSPNEARPLVAGLPNLSDLYQWAVHPPSGSRPPIASDLATALGRLRGRMDTTIATPWFDPPPPKRDKHRPWPDLPPGPALAYGIPFIEVVRRHVRDALFATLATGFYLPAKRLLGDRGPVCWYGQQEAHWIAYYDVWPRLGLARYDPVTDAGFRPWQAIARHAGWFWPDEHRCVVSERPIAPLTFGDGWSIRPTPAAVSPLKG